MLCLLLFNIFTWLLWCLWPFYIMIVVLTFDKIGATVRKILGKPEGNNFIYGILGIILIWLLLGFLLTFLNIKIRGFNI